MERKSLIAPFALAAFLFSAVSAQTPDQEKTGNLELQLKTEDIKHGVPRGFVFLFVNRTGHDMRVPVPVFKCSSSFDGSISLELRFTPKVAPEPSMGSGCAGDGPFGVAIMERVRNWQLLPAGYALALKVHLGKVAWEIIRPGDTPTLHSNQEQVVQPGLRPYIDDTRAGTYEFWALYSPPSVSPADQEALREAGIHFPRIQLRTSRATFEKEQ